MCKKFKHTPARDRKVVSVNRNQNEWVFDQIGRIVLNVNHINMKKIKVSCTKQLEKGVLSM